jgi:hypothetical protein
MMQNSKKLALGYLAQAQALLPKVGIDDHPGDGGPDDGKLTRDDVVRLYTKMMDIQALLGQEPAVKAIFEKATTLILVGKQPHQGVVERLIKSAARHLSKNDAVALYQKYATDGYLFVTLARTLSFEASASLVQGAMELTAQQKELSLWQQGDQYVRIARVVGPKEQALVFTALTALTPKLLGEGFAGPLVLCEASSLGMEIDKAAVERALRAAGSEAPGYVGLGLLWLGKSKEAREWLAKLTDKSHVNAFPLQLVEPLGLADYLVLVKRVKSPTVAYKAALTTAVEREDELRLKLLRFAEAREPGIVGARDWQRLAELTPLEPEHGVALRQIRIALRRDLPEQEKYWKKRPVAGLELSLRQSEWAEIVEQAAEADPPLALKYLPRVTEPRRRITALLALAYVEAQRSRPKGDLG